jgi:hypothetical protein
VFRRPGRNYFKQVTTLTVVVDKVERIRFMVQRLRSPALAVAWMINRGIIDVEGQMLAFVDPYPLSSPEVDWAIYDNSLEISIAEADARQWMKNSQE